MELTKELKNFTKKLEALQKENNDNTLNFAKEWNARWNELRESLWRVGSETLLSNEPQSDSVKTY